MWLSSFLFQLAAFYWVTLPHWATTFGWLALSFYLALYFPLFIGLSRVAVHRLHIAPLVAAPVVWVGLELGPRTFADRFCHGLAFAHAIPLAGRAADQRFVRCLRRQLLDRAGRRGLGADAALRGRGPRVVARHSPGRCLGRTLAYGAWRSSEQTSHEGPKVALIQGSIDIDMKHDPQQGQQIFDEYFGLSRQAVQEHPDLDLIVWPETMFRYPWFTFDKDFVPPADAGWTRRSSKPAAARPSSKP